MRSKGNLSYRDGLPYSDTDHVKVEISQDQIA